MTTTPTKADVEGVQDLIVRSKVKAIEHHELAARWTGQRDERADEIDADMQIQMQHRCNLDDFGFRMVGSITTEFGEANAAVAVTYDYDGEPPTLRTLFAFGNEVAVMTLFPYFREAMSTITAKVFGQPILLPVLERGAVGFELDGVKDVPAASV